METKINIKAKKVILIAFSILLIGFVCALIPPPLPDHFYGSVTVYGNQADIGTKIEVRVAGVLEKIYNVTTKGKYDLYVKSGNISNGIEFKIDNKVAGSATRGWGETTPLDLSITTTTTPSSPPSSSGGSGGGGGGGFVSPSSTTGTSESGSGGSEENTIETQETEEQMGGKQTGITGAVIGFLGSGKGIITVIIVIVLGIGVILIKFKAPKWKRKLS